MRWCSKGSVPQGRPIPTASLQGTGLNHNSVSINKQPTARAFHLDGGLPGREKGGEMVAVSARRSRLYPSSFVNQD